MSSTRRLTLILALIAVAMLGSGAYAYWHFLIRGPFIGATTHDFGNVPLFNETENVQHTFHLTNRLATPLKIVAIRPECGCLTTQDIKQTLQPGEAFDLPVTLIAKGGERVVLIRVVFDDGGMATLRVRANGRYQPNLTSSNSKFALQANGVAEAMFTLNTYETFDDPVPPTIETSSDALHAEFVKWSLRMRPKAQYVDSTPTQWEGVVRVKFSGGDAKALPADASITINWPPARPLVLRVLPEGTVVESSTQPVVSDFQNDEPQPATAPRE